MIKDRQYEILLAVLTFMTIISAHGIWIDYPISAAVRGLDWNFNDTTTWHNLLAVPFITILVLALIFVLAGWKRTASILLAVSILALLAFPALILLLDASWLKNYVEDIGQYEQIQFIVRLLGGIPNAAFGTYLKGAGEFQYLTDRMIITLDMLGWGWIVSFICTSTICWICHKKYQLCTLRFFFWPILSGIIIFSILGSNILRADFHYRAADQNLGLGNYNGALNDYSSALQLDPYLANSSVYINKVSKAYFQLGGANDARGQLYLANNSSNMTQDSINALLVASIMSGDDSLLGEALSNMARKMEAERLIKKSLRAYESNDLGTASIGLRRVLQSYPEWRHAQYFMGFILGQLREYEAADRELNVLLLSIHKDIVKAVIYNTLGDIHSSAGNLEQARDNYSRSYKLDKTANLWAIKGLGGT